MGFDEFGYEYCVKKINPNTLEIEGILNLTDGVSYGGLAIDSDGENIYIYIHNFTDNNIEKWPFEGGNVIASGILDNIYDDSELAIVGEYIGGIGKNGSNVFKILKNFTADEDVTEFSLPDVSKIDKFSYISSINEDFLFGGISYNDGEIVNTVMIERYTNTEPLINKWIVEINNYDGFPDCIVGAYPF